MMIKRLIVYSIFAFGGIPRLGNAQVSDSLDISSLKNPFLSATLEYFVPTLGYAYAGRWRNGLLPNVLRIGGIAIALSAYTGEDITPYPYATGATIGMIGTVWAIVGAAHTAKQTNERVRRENASLSLVFDHNMSPRIWVCYQL